MKTAIFITARLKSTRLPKKAIKPIEGKPMIRHQIERLRLAERPDQIVMCTSPVDEDDPLEQVARNEGIECYRGEPEDVLLRLTNAGRKFDVKTVVSCTADNPLTDPVYIDRLVDFHDEGGYDYSRIQGLPFGTFSYAVSHSAMEKACEVKAKRDTEVWGGYFTDTDYFSVGTLEVDNESVRWPDLRLTVDTPEDFRLMKKVFEHVYQEGKVFPLKKVVNLLENKEGIRKINSDIEQKKPTPIEVKDK